MTAHEKQDKSDKPQGPNPQPAPPTEKKTVRGGLAVDQNLPGIDQNFHYPGGEAQYNADHSEGAAGPTEGESAVRSVTDKHDDQGNQ